MKHRLSRLFFRATALGLAIGVFGCVMAPPEPAARGPEGHWELVTSTFVETGRLPGLPRATLDIANGTLAAYSGCNRGHAAVRVESGRLAVSSLATTRRYCPEPVGSFETRLFQLLGDRPVYHVEGDTLRLVAGDQHAHFKKR